MGFNSGALETADVIVWVCRSLEQHAETQIEWEERKINPVVLSLRNAPGVRASCQSISNGRPCNKIKNLREIYLAGMNSALIVITKSYRPREYPNQEYYCLLFAW